jgi:hypothetical protein
MMLSIAATVTSIAILLKGRSKWQKQELLGILGYMDLLKQQKYTKIVRNEKRHLPRHFAHQLSKTCQNELK